MKCLSINEVLSDKITGEWGVEPEADNSVKIIRTANFTNLGFIDFSNIVFRTIESNKIERKRLISGDVIIEKSGGSPTQPVGRVVYFENPDDSVYLCNNFTTVLRSDKSIVFPKYLFYILFYNHLIKKTLRFQNKTTGIINLKLENYLKSDIPLPENYDDQIRIATVLTKAENLIAKRKQSIKVLDELLKSTFLEMFGDPVRNEKGWEKKELTYFGQIITGNTPPRNDRDNYSPNFIEWIKTDNIVLNKAYITASTEYLSETGLAKARFVTSGALLVACIAGSIESIGRAAIADRKVSFNQQINAIQPDEKINSLYLYWLFEIAKLYIRSHATKGMKKILTKGDFEKIKMIRPPRPLQNQFGVIVEKVEAIKEKYKQSLTELENLYNSLSQRAFKGELDLSRVEIERNFYQLEQSHASKTELKEFAESVDYDELNIKKTKINMQSKAFDINDKIFDIIEAVLEKPMSFDELYKKLDDLLNIESKSEDVNPELDYHLLKKVIFKQLEKASPKLKQFYDIDSKKMMLELLK
jgi:type I restriction enzyme, S subunit